MTSDSRLESSALAPRPAGRLPVSEQKVVVLSIRLMPKLKAAIDRIADDGGMTTLDWIRAVLARAANEGAFAPRKGRGNGPWKPTARKPRAHGG